MLVRVVLCLSLAVLIAGCGGDTSWYFCSGSEDFCRADIPDKDEDKPLTISALEVARSTPQPIDTGLLSDGLEETLNKSPELIAGWLITGSLGLLTDDSDNAAASRFLDNNRYWLAINEDRDIIGNSALSAGLELLRLVAESRDPGVAGAAAGAAAKMVSLRGAGTPEQDPADQADQQTQALQQAANLLNAYSAQRCCSVDELMAAAVLLCDADQLPAAIEVAQACAVANRWLGSDPGER